MLITLDEEEVQISSNIFLGIGRACWFLMLGSVTAQHLSVEKVGEKICIEL